MDDADLFDLVRDNLPFLNNAVFIAKKVNDDRGVEDSHAEVVRALLAMLACLSNKDLSELEPPARRNKHLEKMEAESSEHLRKLNDINRKIRKGIEKHNSLIKELKDAKVKVQEEYKDILGQFKEIIQDDSSTEERNSHFNSILEEVIREVIVDSEATPLLEEKDCFEALFEDQNLIDEFEGVFEQDSVLRSESPVPPPPTSASPVPLPDPVLFPVISPIRLRRH